MSADERPFSGTNTVRTTADLAALVIPGNVIQPGFQVYVSDLKSFFTYTIGNVALVADQVVAVAGTTGARWIIASAGTTPVVAANTVTVAPTGNDANDGETAPVQTWTRGLFLLNALGGGTLKVENNCWANLTTGGGLKIRGGGDPGHGGTDWVFIDKVINIESGGNPFVVTQGAGVSFLAPGGGAGDFINEPALWLAGTGQNLTFNNIYFATEQANNVPSVRIGISSPLDAWNSGVNYGLNDAVIFGGIPYHSLQTPNLNQTPGVATDFWAIGRSSLVYADGLSACFQALTYFNDCTFQRTGLDTAPAVDHGADFWTYHNNCTFDRSGVTGTANPLLNCAVRYPWNPLAAGSYLQFYDTAYFGPTGIYSLSDSGVVINNATIENALVPLAVLVTDTGVDRPYAAKPEWEVDTLVNADPANHITPEFRVLDNQTAGHVVARHCQVITGKVIVDQPSLEPQNAAGGGTATHFLLGTSGAASILQQDSARRTFGPAAAQFPNVALGLPTAWASATAPDGSSTAGTYDNNPAHLNTFFTDGNTGQVLANGDRLIFGGWVRWTNIAYDGTFIINNSAGSSTFYLGGYNVGQSNVQVTLAPGAFIQWIVQQPSADKGQWVYNWGWIKMVTRGTGRISIENTPRGGGQAWRNCAQIIPASHTEIDDNEVAQMALHMQGVANHYDGATVLSPAAGSFPMWPGVKLGFFDATLGVWKYLDIDNGAVRIT